MDDLMRKKVTRKVLRTHCKKLESEISDLIQIFNYSKAVELQALKANYEDKIDRIAELDDDILSLIADENQLELELSISLSEKDMSYQILSKIEYCLSNIRPVRAAQPSPPKPVPPQEIQSLAKKKSKRLKVNIGKFDGNPINWPSFWVKYESTVHNQNRLTPIEKLTVLRGLLNPSARECISGLSLTRANYAEAVRILREKFENSQLLVYSYIDTFTKIPKVNSIEQIPEIRIIYAQLENLLQSITKLNVNVDSYKTLLVPMLITKLPCEIRKALTKTVKIESSFNLFDVLTAFKAELDVLETCAKFSNQALKKQVVDVFNVKCIQKESKGTQSTLGNCLKQNERTCIFCRNGTHETAKCQVVTNVHSRSTILREGGRCFLCLEEGHCKENCDSSTPCGLCNEWHHVCLCNKRKKEDEDDNVFEDNVGKNEDDEFKGDVDVVPRKQRYSSFVEMNPVDRRRLQRIQSCHL